MNKTLDELLHGPSALPVLVKPDGTFETAAYPPPTLVEYAPESVYVDWSGDWEMPDILKEHERAALDDVENGWELLTGWGDDGSLFIFRSDRQHLGADLEEHIRETPGLWAIVSVDMNPPTCEGGEDGMPCTEYDQRERCDHADYPSESQGAGWALVRRNRAVTLGGDESPVGGQPYWPVLRDGEPTGTHVTGTMSGYVFRVPHTMAPDGFGHKGEPRVTVDDARKDAEEWLTENLA
jgi:hypothetical protein